MCVNFSFPMKVEYHSSLNEVMRFLFDEIT